MKYGDLAEINLEGQEPVKGILIKVRNPPKTAVLRYPSPDETLVRMNSVRQLRIVSGNREPKITWPVDSDSERAFFKTIRVDSGIEFDDAEIQSTLAKLTSCRLVDCEANESGYEITIETIAGIQTHFMDEPTLADLKQCRDKLVTTKSLGTGRTEFRYPPAPAIKLYDQVAKRAEGYADGFSIPPDHKYVVTMALINKVDELDSNVQIGPN